MPAPSPSCLFYDTDNPLFWLAWHEPPPPGADIPEAVVQDIWREQRLRKGSLHTTGGERVEIISPGEINHDGGPDFRFARLRIGETVWFGDVEIHTTSRGWRDHAHDRDERYNSVVLHVALQPDLWTGTLRRSDSSALPELILAPHLDSSFRDRLVHFFTHPTPARPCTWGFAATPPARLQTWLTQCARDRVMRRAARFASEDTFLTDVYAEVAATLGYRPNADPMRRLARRVALADLHTLRSAHDREALLLGMAGLLPSAEALARSEDEAARAYGTSASRRFEALQPRDHRPLAATEWQYARLRPANFPELRIAQLAALAAPGGLLSPAGLEACRGLLHKQAPQRAFQTLFDVRLHPFWHTHYRLDRAAAPHSAAVGASTRQRLLVNVLLPATLAASGMDDRVAQQVMHVMAAMPAENDRLTRSFPSPPAWQPSLLFTQGLHELDRSYCQQQRCLSCAVGNHLVSASAVSSEAAVPRDPCSSESSTFTSVPRQ